MRSSPAIPSSTSWRLASALGIFGSIDMNRNDYQSGWDTDQFPNNVPEMALAYYEVLRAGGFTTGGTNFDAKLRAPVDRSGRPDHRSHRREWTAARAA